MGVECCSSPRVVVLLQFFAQVKKEEERELWRRGERGP